MDTLKKVMKDSGNIDVLPEDQVHKLLADHCVGSLGYLAHGTPYVVPITYFYNREDHDLEALSKSLDKARAVQKDPEKHVKFLSGNRECKEMKKEDILLLHQWLFIPRPM